MKSAEELKTECFALCRLLMENEKKDTQIEIKENLFFYASGALAALMWANYTDMKCIGPARTIREFFKFDEL